MKKWIGNHIPLLFIVISICSISQWLTLPLNYEVVWFIVYLGLLYGLWNKTKEKNIRIVTAWLIYIVLQIFYGALFMVENYFDTKALVYNSMIFFLALGAYSFRSPLLILQIYNKWIKYVWIIYICLFPFMTSDAHGRYLFPFCLFLLFFPCIDKKLKIFSLFSLGLNLFLGHDNRSDIIRFCFAFVLGLSYLKFSVVRKCSRYMMPIMYVLPFLFLILSLTDQFSIFKYMENYSMEKQLFGKQDEYGYKNVILEDTRTLLYIEVINTSVEYSSIIFGRSPARGYKSEKFGEWTDLATGTNRGERGGCEVSILNVYNYLGIVGVLLYTMIFICASYSAIYHSKNKYVPIIGIYIAFRWMYSWVEEFTAFNMSSIMMWMCIGMCFSDIFRNMTDSEFNNWIKMLCNAKRKDYRY